VTDVELDRLFVDGESVPGNDELRDPGLHPGFQLFVANLLTGYLRYAPQRINALVSAFFYLHRDAQRQNVGVHSDLLDLSYARTVFLDSGAISPLLGVTRGTHTPEYLRWYVQQTDLVVGLAHKFADLGIKDGVVAMLDLPAYVDLLAGAGLSVAEAHEVTLSNARQMAKAELPEGWRPVFVSQGLTLNDHMAVMAEYESIGALDMVRAGNAWLSIGGVAFEGATQRIHTVAKAVRNKLGEGHIHILGVNRLHALIPMVRHGWVNSCDSSSPAQEIRFNRGVYHTDGPRPTFLWEAMHAASALYYEATLAMELKRLANEPLYEQEELFG
jgi:hypothetical protein